MTDAEYMEALRVLLGSPYTGYCLDCGYRPIGREACPDGDPTCVFFGAGSARWRLS